jgi:uncharacterized BrkB/YihY/UPF0761 family membrane protein
MERAREHSTILDVAFLGIERDSDIGGGILAGALAYRLFLVFLPLTFLGVALLGLFSDVAGTDPRTAADEVGLIAVVSREVARSAESGASLWVALTALVVLVYVTRVLHRSVAIVHALAWKRSGAEAKTVSRSFGFFALGVAAQLALTIGVGAVRAHSTVGGVFALLAYVLAVAGVWLAVSLRLPHGVARWTDLVPGSLLYGTGILGVHAFNVYLLGRLVESRSSTYGALGVAAAVLLGLYLIGRLVVGGAVLNAVLYDRKTRPGDLLASPGANDG